MGSWRITNLPPTRANAHRRSSFGRECGNVRAGSPFVDGVPPAWATCWGDSDYGPWAGFLENHIVYAMYWIPPGRFLMGSPKTEVGREDREEAEPFFEIQHEVVLSGGFWMGEWPCMQDLWMAVMGENPSRFQDPWRPVENVSWEDTQVFLQKLNARHPGLEARLPTEAEWEYACRAGTSTATYAGDLDIRGVADAPILDEMAWYRGNSSVEFDLEDGQDVTGWRGEQYPGTAIAGTRRVATRRPNAWGLHDMLGNVWELCQDWHEPYTANAQQDPRGPARGDRRVIRGGAWNSGARHCRAANRLACPPSFRFDDLGFRFVRGRAAVAEPADKGPERL